MGDKAQEVQEPNESGPERRAASLTTKAGGITTTTVLLNSSIARNQDSAITDPRSYRARETLNVSQDSNSGSGVLDTKSSLVENGSNSNTNVVQTMLSNENLGNNKYIHETSAAASISMNETRSSHKEDQLALSSSAGSSPFNDNRRTTAVFDTTTTPLSVAFFNEIVTGYVTRSIVEELDILAEAHIATTEDVCKQLKVSPSRGLAADHDSDWDWRIQTFGVNKMPSKAKTPFWRLVYDASADFMLRILMVAAVVSLVLSIAFGEKPEIEWIEGAAILLAVIIVIMVTAINDWMKEKQFAELYAQEEKRCSVIRNGQIQNVDTRDVMVGDIVAVETGDEIPADGLLLKGQNLTVDESSLTGESDYISKLTIAECLVEVQKYKDEIEDAKRKIQQGENTGGKTHHLVASPVCLSGSVVSSGSGRLLIIAVGIKSQVGRLFTKLTVDTEPTPLQNKLNALARDVGNLGFLAAIVTLLVLIVEYWIMYAFLDSSSRPDGGEIAQEMVNFIVISITIVVVAVPEGLPLAVTISLAFSVNKMLEDQNYVRRLAACETMGGANEICSDKTGTLTKNQMEVEAFWNGSELTPQVVGAPPPRRTASPSQRSGIESEGRSRASSVASDNTRPSQQQFMSKEYMDIFAANVSANSTGYIERSFVDLAGGGGGSKGMLQKEMTKQVGSPTECALLLFIEAMGYDYNQIRREYQGGEIQDEATGKLTKYTDRIILKIPFSSDRKIMTTVVQHPTESDKLRVFTKGAAEVVLRRCSQRVDSAGELKSLNAQKIQSVEDAVIRRLASQALRTICVAYKDFNPDSSPGWDTLDGPLFYKVETELTCLGIAGIRDPVRDEVPAAVRACQNAGIKVRMCTGDNIETAKQIALKCNIYHPESGGIAMLGAEFSKMVGGVVCAKCRTVECPCPTVAQDNDSTTTGGDDDDDTISEGAPRRSSDVESVNPAPTPASRKGKRAGKGDIRQDVLGNESAFEQIADHLEVLARSQPNDKYVLVTGLKNRGAVVAVTGDGTNDAPALKKADVGFAMGITGKEVAKQAADIVLMDDNFESIVRAVKWGRNIFDNIRKFLQFQLTVNIVAVATAFIGAVVLRDSILTAVQMLWVNLIMDTLGALALATEPPKDSLLNRQPHSRTEYLISKTMFRNIIAQAIYQLSVMFTLVFSGDCWLPEYPFYVSDENRLAYPDYSEFSETCGNGHTVRSGRRYYPFSDREDYKMAWTNNIGPSRHFTYVFNVFVFMQIFNLINARKIGVHEYGIFNGLLSNTTWIIIFIGITFGQVILVEFGSFAVSCHPDGLTWQQWLTSVALGAGSLLVGFLVKFLPSKVVEALPETGVKEVSVLAEPASIALASRGRISSGRISQRMILTGSGKVHPALTGHPLYGAYNRRRTVEHSTINREIAASQREIRLPDSRDMVVSADVIRVPSDSQLLLQSGAKKSTLSSTEGLPQVFREAQRVSSSSNNAN